MSAGNQPKTRSDLVASVKLPPGTLAKGWLSLQRSETWVRIAACFAAGLAMWFITGGWSPPLGFRRGDVPHRNIVTRAEFQVEDPQETLRLQHRARRTIRCIYQHDPQVIPELLQVTKDKFFQIAQAESLDKIDPELWKIVSSLPVPTANEGAVAPTSRSQEALTLFESAGFYPDLAIGPIPLHLDLNFSLADLRQLEFLALRNQLADDANLDRLEANIQQAFASVQRDGLLDKLQHDDEMGIATEIQVVPMGSPQEPRKVWVHDVLMGEVTVRLKQRLQDEIKSPLLTQAVFNWIKTRLKPSLTLDKERTVAFAEEAAGAVPPFLVTYRPGDLLARAGAPLDDPAMNLLNAEWQQILRTMSLSQRLRYGLAKAGMFVACFALCGWYLFVRSRHLIRSTSTLSRILLLSVATMTLVMATQANDIRAELIPLLLFSMVVVIAYQHELAILLSATMALMAVLSLGLDLPHLVIYFAAMSVTALLLRQLRHRTRLLYVSLATAVIVALTSLGICGLYPGSPLDFWGDPATTSYLQLAAMYALYTVFAGLIMTGLLPFVERAFDVQTELSLLELGDVAHPLLQELVRRAPGTFNHSMNVASIAEAAAEAINANGLLVRVGAYFHDIGKMLKPSYFVENQARDENRHESLLPAMSTLIIISHVKDGADLARQHNLPNAIIDFIRQHHGTTLVEYFYHRASEQLGQSPDAGRVEEGTYRYPGPKPRTKEAAILMLSDAVEGAGRTLSDPTPAKIEGLVHDLTMKRLLDGQFDECGLTLRELKRIEVSLIKSLSALCHGRIRYPDQQVASLSIRA